MWLTIVWWGWGCGGTGGQVRAPDPPPPAEAAADPLCTDPLVTKLARGARTWAETSLATSDFGTGTPLFDQEWLFGTWAMTTVGLGQHARLCPASAEPDVRAMRAALKKMLSEDGLAFDTGKYGTPVTARLGDTKGSIAALGYGGLALAMHRALAPDHRLSSVEASWIAAIDRRLGKRLVETYPRERYPVDNAAAIAALSLHDRVTGEDHGASLRPATAAVARAVHAPTGLLHQAVASDFSPLAPPRGSGTFLSAWFLHRADPSVGRGLYESGRDTLGMDVFGVYGMREFLPGVDAEGDVDSGPLILGISVSATGFALGGAVAYGDGTTRDHILETMAIGAEMAVGMVPGLETNPGSGATGSALGDAIMLAMLTSRGSP